MEWGGGLNSVDICSFIHLDKASVKQGLSSRGQERRGLKTAGAQIG
jgi:hypothetical protein